VNNLEQYRKRFYNLLESKTGNVKLLISETSESETQKDNSESNETKNFLDKLDNLYKSNKSFTKQESPISYDSDVEIIQTALQITGFALPKWGVDGKFGNETETAVKNFQNSLGIEENGIADSKIIGKLSVLTADEISKNEDVLKGVQKTKIETLPQDKEKSDVKAKTTTDDEYVIIQSDQYEGKNVHVLFGGYTTNPSYSQGGANMTAMKKYIPHLTPYSKNVIVVVTHHMNTLSNVKKYVEEKFGGIVTSIAGFSQGGRETWKHADDSTLRLVGLIDPSTYETGLKFGPNTYLYCDPVNWGKSGFYGQTRKRLEWYCEHEKEYDGKVICFRDGGTHMNFKILISFYQKFGNQL